MNSIILLWLWFPAEKCTWISPLLLLGFADTPTQTRMAMRPATARVLNTVGEGLVMLSLVVLIEDCFLQILLCGL